MVIKDLIVQLSPVLDELIKTNNFYLVGKIVFEEDDKYYRLSNITDAQRRIGLYRYFKKNKCPILMEEKVLILNKVWCLTEQEKLAPFKPDLSQNLNNIDPIRDSNTGDYYRLFYRAMESRIYKDYGQEVYANAQRLFDECDILWPHEQNMGIDKNNKLKIYDYAANVAILNEVLVDKDMNPLITMDEINMRRPGILPS